MKAYPDNFYWRQQQNSPPSAKVVVPLVAELIKPKSVVDLGSGIGSWLYMFRQHGADDILGVDGVWVDKNMLIIPDENFVSFDLQKPFLTDRRFDLAVCIEVAEHLPPESARELVNSLVSLAPVILFAAAIPYQGGTHHTNEQWPDYWAGLFRNKGYVSVDYIRKRIWNDSRIKWWYRQNIVFYVKKGSLNNYPALKKEYESNGPSPLALVHPELFIMAQEQLRSPSLGRVLRLLPRLVINEILQRVGRLF